jgi:hypothetical protein
MRLLHLALVAPEAREAHGGAEFPGFCLLLTSDSERTLEIRFGPGGKVIGRLESNFARNAIDLSLISPFLCCLDGR